MSLSSFLRNPFSIFGSSKSSEERMATYLLREHEQGRTIKEILDDPYVKNRSTPNEVARVLDRPEVIRSLGEATVASAKAEIRA